MTDIYYLTGTGNCLSVARAVANRIGGRAIAIRDVIASHSVRTDAQIVGIVFPTYLAAISGVPLIVERFIGKFDGLESKYHFAICTCGGYEIVNAVPTLRNFAQLVRSTGARLAAEYTVRLPMNNLDYEHIPVPIVTDEQTILANSEKQIEDICRMIIGRRQGRYHVFRRLFTVAMTPLYAVMRKACITALKEHAKEPESSPLGFRELIPLTDRSIRLDDGCTGCGICVQMCPVGNIAMAEGRPVWHHRCEMCFACDEWCPKSAIHHWGRPNGAKYHHPDVKVTDLIGTQNSPTS